MSTYISTLSSAFRLAQSLKALAAPKHYRSHYAGGPVLDSPEQTSSPLVVSIPQMSNS